jgi:exodeoxyribonuclease V gamma subunit
LDKISVCDAHGIQYIASMAFHLISSNSMEALADKLAGMVREEPLHPLQEEIIVVQSQGMARWLSMELATRLSVWAHGSFPFPNKFLDDIVGLVLPDSSGRKLFSRSTAVWQIMNLFHDLPALPVFAPVRNYLDAPLKKYQLAGAVADLFDQYALYRPDMLENWEKGVTDDWQAILWMMLVEKYTLKSRAGVLSDVVERLAQTDQIVSLPPRVSVFGVSLLPPLYLDVFHALSKHIDIHFFYLNPCCHWWADIKSEKEIFHLSRKHGESKESLYLEIGNPLLASMGGLGRDCLAMLQEYDLEEVECYVPPVGSSLLHSIQRDVLDLSTGDGDRLPDDSIVINSCHSPMREVEVLQNHLLSLFEENETLGPRDIIVMAPDVELYSPFIQTVFGLGKDDPRYIPFAIADSSMVRHNQLADTFLALLDLAGSRFENSVIRGIFKCQPVQARFGLTNDLEKIDEWLDGTAIRWGRDKEHRKALGLPGFSENTWRTGFDRLLLGYAMTGEELFQGTLPYEGVEEGDGDILGRMLEAFDILCRHVEKLEKLWSLNEWASVLLDLLDGCMAVGQEQEDDLQYLRTVIHELGSYQEQAAYTDRLSLEVIKAYLVQILDKEKSPYGYLSGGITFCAMLPMRAVPFKIVCLLGVEDGSFPRPQPVLSFDRMAEAPRLGDRSRRDDDRYLFFEALLSARKQFYLSFVGQSIRDDTILPPSVLVSELLEYVGQVCRKDDGCKSGSDMITRHRLQPFNPEYFRSGQLSSYDEVYCKASQRLLEGPDPAAGFWKDLPLSPPGKEFLQVDVQDLISFILHPVRFFSNRRLSVILSQAKESMDDDEPVGIAGLSRYVLSQDAAGMMLKEKETSAIMPLLQAKGMLPHGMTGEICGTELMEDAALFVSRFHQLSFSEPQAFDVDIQCGEFHIQGRLKELRDNGLLFARCGSIKGKDLLRAWIGHVLLNCMAETDDALPRTSILLGRDETQCLKRVDTPYDILHTLLDVYWQGLCEPLPFFAETSLVFAQGMAAKRPYRARTAAQKKWAGEFSPYRECDDLYFSFCYADRYPLDTYFEELALQVYLPLFKYLDDWEGDAS